MLKKNSVPDFTRKVHENEQSGYVQGQRASDSVKVTQHLLCRKIWRKSLSAEDTRQNFRGFTLFQKSHESLTTSVM